MKKILCVGSVTADLLVCGFTHLPSPGQLTPFHTLGLGAGGCAANAALDLARLGAAPLLACKLGADLFGQAVEKQLFACLPAESAPGITLDPEAPTTLSVVLVNKGGERSFLYHPGSAARFRAADVPPALLAQSDIVFVAGAMLLGAFDGNECAHFLSACRAAGKFTVMDTAWDYENIWLAKIAPSLPFVDLFMPSLEEAARLTKESSPSLMAKAFKNLGAKNVVIKLGKEGALVSPEASTEFISPAFLGMPAPDTTGAGDAFCAGFLYALSLAYPFSACAAFGAATAAHAVTKLGASAGIPPAKEIFAFLQSRGVALPENKD